MSKKVIGKILLIIGAIAIMINVSFFREADWYHTTKWISYAVFMIGLFMIPIYSKSKSNT